MNAMADAYNQLLDATIQHLEDLKSRGVRHVAVSPEALRALAQPAKESQISNLKSQIQPVATGAPEAGAPQPLSRRSVTKADAITAQPAAEQKSLLPLPGESVSSQSPPLDPQAKAAAFAALRERALACVKCPHLASSRKTVVFGVGSIDAQLMFVGEAPGADEDEQGLPFVGRAGQLLTKMIESMGFRRDDVYIANVLKCRPPGNRPPRPDEVATCEPFLRRQIGAIAPEVICTLGSFAAQAVLRRPDKISTIRGRFFVVDGVKVLPTYHPAYLLRNPAEKRTVWEDLQKVMAMLKKSTTPS